MKNSQTVSMKLTLTGNASSEQADLFDYFTNQSPTEAMNFLYRLAKGRVWQNMKANQTDEEKIETSILSQLQNGKVQIDELIWETGFATSMVNAQLMVMELNGAIKKLAGGFYVLMNCNQALPHQTLTLRPNHQLEQVITKVAPLPKQDINHLPDAIHEFFADKDDLRQAGVTSNESVITWLREQGFSKRAQDMREIINKIREEVLDARESQN